MELVTTGTANPKMIDAIGDKENRVVIGELAHAIRECNRYIFNTSKFCVKQQMTGHLRSLPIRGINDIEIVMMPKFGKDLAGDTMDGFTQTELHYWMIEKSPYKMIPVPQEDSTPQTQYRFQTEGYLWKIHLVRTLSALNIMQMIRTGPKEFREWITEEESRGGALPWGWYFQKGKLYNSNRKTQTVKSESEIFELIGYSYIPVHARYEGSPIDWQSAFKKRS